MRAGRPHSSELPLRFGAFLAPAPCLMLLSGPSGVGKDAVIQRLRDQGLPFETVVTVTTRPPRNGEENGREYGFVSRVEFERMLDGRELVEHAEVYGHLYGIPRAAIDLALLSQRDVVLRIGPTGLPSIRLTYPQTIAVFLVPEAISDLKARLAYRTGGGDLADSLRSNNINSELELAKDFDYIVVNPQGKIDEAAESIKAILRAEKCRVARRR